MPHIGAPLEGGRREDNEGVFRPDPQTDEEDMDADDVEETLDALEELVELDETIELSQEE